MAILTEGNWKVKVLGGTAGADNEGNVVARVNIEFLDGPDKGRRATYDERIDNKSGTYVKDSLAAAGWKGASLRTVADDLKVGKETTAEVVHYVTKKGKNEGKPFAKIRNIGRDARPLVDASAAQLAEAEAMMNGTFGETDFGPGSYDDEDVR